MAVHSVIHITYMIYMKEYHHNVSVGLHMCYMSVGVYLIKMNIYSFACEIIVYIHRESQRDQHAVYVCCTLFAINILDVDIHIYMTVWSIKLQCRIFFKIYCKLYVEHYFMCISIFFRN